MAGTHFRLLGHPLFETGEIVDGIENARWLLAVRIVVENENNRRQGKRWSWIWNGAEMEGRKSDEPDVRVRVERVEGPPPLDEKIWTGPRLGRDFCDRDLEQWRQAAEMIFGSGGAALRLVRD